jgi:branched-chain amino acid aminotransferase
MTYVYPKSFFDDQIIPFSSANLSIACSAVLYGLSVYTVLPICVTKDGKFAFRLEDHLTRLVNSCQIIGLDNFAKNWNQDLLKKALKETANANALTKTVFARVTVHGTALVPGTKAKGIETKLSIFLYEANSIITQNGARVKTSVWRRVPDYCIPSRAKVNGAYVNSVLAKQDALDSGFDDCIFLDSSGHVCELSAANLFLVKDDVLLTPDKSSDILEGINRDTIIKLAEEMGIKTSERKIDLTELYTADEVFACGTSAFVAPITEIDGRKIGRGKYVITEKLREEHEKILTNLSPSSSAFLTRLA